jgi:PPOX class probable F420-dependent enzyme
VDTDQAREFVTTNHRAVLTTIRDDGSPQMSPVAVAVGGGGHLVVSTRQGAMKTRNLRERPKAWLCVFTEAFFGPWVQVEGDVEIVELPAAMEPLVEYYRQVGGEHSDWAEYRAAMDREQRVLLRISINRAGPDLSG